MRNKGLIFLLCFIIMGMTSFAATKKVATANKQFVLNTDLQGLGAEILMKKPTFIYGGGLYFSDNNLGAYGVIGKDISNTNFTGLAKLGLVDDNGLNLTLGLGLGYKINSNYEIYLEGNSDRGLVIGFGMKI